MCLCLNEEIASGGDGLGTYHGNKERGRGDVNWNVAEQGPSRDEQGHGIIEERISGRWAGADGRVRRSHTGARRVRGVHYM